MIIPAWIRYAAPFMAGVFVMWLYHSAAVSRINESVALERQKAAESSQLVASKAQKEVAKIDQYYHEKLQRELASVPEPKRVFVRASCPAVPATGVSGVGNGEGKPELDEEGRRLVRDLRQGILRVEGKLEACQAILSGDP